MTYRKKLIEVALPLEAINVASAREKSIRHGHPSTLHLWWSRKPLATARAVLFASLIDDPSSRHDLFPSVEQQDAERERLFGLIRELVKWENVNNPVILKQARKEIERSTDGNPPPVLDPFAGGGSIPLEAQRLGLEAHASDLNPVAVLINKALIEIPPRFADQAPIHPDQDDQMNLQQWRGAAGLAEDVRYYGEWMRERALERIGHLYPQVELPKEYGGGQATVIAWLWVRTVPCPNPACKAQMPLVRSYDLATKKGKEAWLEPIVDHENHTVKFEVKTGKGKPPKPPKVGRGAQFRCLVCNQIADDKHIKSEGIQGRMSAQLIAIVAEGNRQRVYLAPTEEHEYIAKQAKPEWKPVTELPKQALGFNTQLYGISKHSDLFTDRQLVALTTFTNLVTEVQEHIIRDAVITGIQEGVSLDQGGTGARAYADAVTVYLALAASKLADNNSTICSWMPGVKYEVVRNTFSRQAIPMSWDFAESNPFASSSGDYYEQVKRIIKVFDVSINSSTELGIAVQQDVLNLSDNVQKMISTDPPYYDYVGYSDLADFFYIWLRESLKSIFPDLLSTLLVPKAQELVATPFRFDGNREAAQDFFETGFRQAFKNMNSIQHPEYPLTVYYAFKQSENDKENNIASTGWETMLEGMIGSGWQITGTWPMRTERPGRTRDTDSNALASSIVLVCRPRPEHVPDATRREFISSMQRELPEALRNLQHGNIAPVDLAQAAIGPGMAVFSRYAQVLESDGTPMRVRTALQLINQTLDEVLAEQEGDYDSDTRWALAWYEQYGTSSGAYGSAETLSKAKNTAIEGLVEAGILEAKSGKVRLLSRSELPENWRPSHDQRVTIWEVTQHLCRALDKHGESGAASLLQQVGNERGDIARDLAYRLYTTCERKGWAQEALAYNSLVVAWPEIVSLASRSAAQVQASMEL